MKIKLSSSYGNISHPNHICPSPAKCWKRLKAEREAKLHALNCTCQSLLSVSPKVISHQGPQRTGGNMDTCGAGSMNCWEEKLTAGVRAAGRSETSNWDVAVRCPLPTNSTPFLQGLDWPPFSDTCSFSCLPPPPKLPSGVPGRAVSFPTLHLEVEWSPTWCSQATRASLLHPQPPRQWVWGQHPSPFPLPTCLLEGIFSPINMLSRVDSCQVQ